MPRLLVPTRLLLVSLLAGPLACGSSDPEAAAKAAKSAGGALEPLSPLPDKTKIDPKLPDGPGLPGPGDFKPPPVEAGATCITDDDPPTTTDKPPAQKIPPKTPKLPGQQLDPSEPKIDGPAPKSASSIEAKPAIGDELDGRRRSATSSPSTTTVKRPLDYASLCETKMSDECSTFCSERGLTWDRSAGSNGTCFSLSSSTSEGSTSTTYECGCMCK